MQNYSHIREQIKSMDLILVLGNRLFSKVIQLGEVMSTGYSDYSHCGMCFRGEDFPQSSPLYKPGKIYILEALDKNREDGVDAAPGTPSEGVQLRDLDEVLRANNAQNGRSLAWLPLKQELRVVVTQEKNLELCQAMMGRSYDYNPFNFLGATFRVLRCMRCVCAPVFNCLLRWHYKGRVPAFCSMIVVEYLQAVGVLAYKGINPKNTLPIDFVPSAENPCKTYDADSEIPVIYGSPVPIVL